MPWSHITSKTKFSPLTKFFSNFNTGGWCRRVSKEFGELTNSGSGECRGFGIQRMSMDMLSPLAKLISRA
jgi:hypothetical protein